MSSSKRCDNPKLTSKKHVKYIKTCTESDEQRKYVVHYTNLAMWSFGLKLKKIHIILEFNEKPWMEPYINLITELRK